MLLIFITGKEAAQWQKMKIGNKKRLLVLLLQIRVDRAA